MSMGQSSDSSEEESIEEEKSDSSECESTEESSEYEIAARTARAEHSTATVSLLQSLNSMNHSMKVFTGNAFIIRLANGGAKLITCQHIIYQNRIDDDYHLWARFYGADEDVKATIQYYNVRKDIAILDVDQLPNTNESPTVLEFSEEIKFGSTVTLLSYFNPDNMEELLEESNPIAKMPNAVPGQITGPLVLDRDHPEENWLISFDCYGVYGSCGSPIISYQTGRAVAMYKQSIEQIHFGIATKTIEVQLRRWLTASEEATIEEMIAAL